MTERPCGVHVVVDPEYGEHLRNLPAGEPVWIVDSQVNRSAVNLSATERNERDHTTGITRFRFNPDETPEDWLIEELWTIDLHHGPYSHDPPYAWLNVIGTSWSTSIQEALDELGFFEHEATAEGFIARRNLSEWRPSAE
jgi:hypothetical protein